MKKILFLIHDLGHGGAEKVLVNLVNNLDREKFDITVMALFGGGVNEQFLRRDIRLIHCHGKAMPGNSHLMKLLTPISAIFSGISGALSKFFADDGSSTVTEEDLISIIDTLEDEGVLEPEQQALVNSAMEFREKKAEDIMIPIEFVVRVSSTIPLQELAETIKNLPYSRIPVYEGREDNIVGILPVNLFLSCNVSGKPVPLRKMLMKPYVFDSNTEISVLLQRMRLNKLHMVFVVDENRKKLGIITMEDLLEELVGDIQDESDLGEGLELL